MLLTRRFEEASARLHMQGKIKGLTFRRHTPNPRSGGVALLAASGSSYRGYIWPLAALNGFRDARRTRG